MIPAKNDPGRISMKRVWAYIRLFYYLTRISKNPQNTMAALKIAECMLKLGLITPEVQRIRSTPEGKDALDKRAMISSLNLDDLQKYPEGTLAKEYSDRMKAENLSPDFYNLLEIDSDETYVMMRLRQTHDLWHTITGFGTSVADELGLQAFVMAQTHSPLSPVLIGSRLVIEAIKNPGEARHIVNQVSKGWQMGVNAKPLFAFDWESNWNAPLNDVRMANGI